MSKRLEKEWQRLVDDPDEQDRFYIHSKTITQSKLAFDCMILVADDADTPYAGLCLPVRLNFPKEYPFKPPTVVFPLPVLHPLICSDIHQSKWMYMFMNKWGPRKNVRWLLTLVHDSFLTLEHHQYPRHEAPPAYVGIMQAKDDVDDLLNFYPSVYNQLVRNQIQAIVDQSEVEEVLITTPILPLYYDKNEKNDAENDAESDKEPSSSSTAITLHQLGGKLVPPYCVNAHGVVKRPDSHIALWMYRIFPFLGPSPFDRPRMRWLCRLFRDSLPPRTSDEPTFRSWPVACSPTTTLQSVVDAGTCHKVAVDSKPPCAGTFIHIILGARELYRESDNMTIRVNTMAGQMYPIPANENDLVELLLEKVRYIGSAHLGGLPLHRIRLLHGGKHLDPRKTLAECGVSEEETLTIHLKPGECRDPCCAHRRQMKEQERKSGKSNRYLAERFVVLLDEEEAQETAEEVNVYEPTTFLCGNRQMRVIVGRFSPKKWTVSACLKSEEDVALVERMMGKSP